MSLVKINGIRKLRKIRTPRDADLAGGVFNFNLYNGSDGSGPGNKIFQTSRNFVVDDKSLMVFKNGEYMYEGADYQILDSRTVLFVGDVQPVDKIAMIVNGGTILRDYSASNTFNINQIAGDLYRNGNGSITNSGDKFFAPNYSLQSLTSTVHAVVGPTGTHDNLQSAIDDVASGSRILVDLGTYSLASPININKENLTIEGVGRGTVFSGAGIGFNVTAAGVLIEKIKFQNFSTAVYIRSENCMVTRNWFGSNTTDIDYLTVSNVVIEGNIKE
jgi:hypothetical protein